MSFLVRDILSEGQKPFSVPSRSSVQSALRSMREHNFSQLPLVDDEGKYTGRAVTERSIIDALSFFGAPLDKLLVDDVSIRVGMLRADADLLEVLDEVQREGFRVIVDASEKVVGIVTTTDTTAHFRRYAEDLMVVKSIEAMLKEAIQSLFRDDPQGLLDKIERVVDRDAEARKKVPRAVEMCLKASGQIAIVKSGDAGVTDATVFFVSAQTF